MKKHLFAVILVLSLLISMINIPVTAAETSGTCGDNISWELDKTGTLTLSGEGELQSKYTVTSKSGWYPIRAQIKKVVIEEGITSIGNEAFYDCYNLSAIKLPHSLEKIGDSAFYNCKNVLHIDIPSSVNYFGLFVFGNWSPDSKINITNLSSWCSATFVTSPAYNAGDLLVNGVLVEDLVIPEGVKSVNENAFAYASQLKSVVIPDSVETIGRFAFEKCTTLQSVIMGKGIKKIDANAFNKCEGLNSLYISDISAWANIDFYSASANPLIYTENFYLNGNAVTDITITGEGKITPYSFYQYKGLKSVTIEDGITEIGDYAFYECTKLENLKIGNDVKSIGEQAFAYCQILQPIEFGTGLETIGKEAFKNCQRFVEFSFPEGVKEIGYAVFNDCYYLTDVYIPSSVTKFNGSFAINCAHLKRIHITDLSAWLKIDFGQFGQFDVLANPNRIEQLQLLVNGELLTELKVPEDVTEIPAYSFYGYRFLEKIIFHDEVTKIDNRSFAYCENLSELELPDNLKELGIFVFKGCIKIDNIEIPESLKKLNQGTFEGCTALNRVLIGEGTATISYSAFMNCTALEEIVLPKSMRNIEDGAFNGCTSDLTVKYCGTEKQWGYISIGYNNGELNNANFIYGYVEPIIIDLYGDINDDDIINAVDAALIKMIIVGNYTQSNARSNVQTTARAMLAADVNNDGIVNSIDSYLIKMIIVGIA